MKAILSMSIVAALATVQGVGYAQATNPSAKKPLAQTSCKDYLEMDETIKPKFIFYTVGYSKHGKPVAENFDVVGVDKMKPMIDEYCRVNLKASAYEKVMNESKASEKTNR
jgi:acid stress chaperone HdeA